MNNRNDEETREKPDRPSAPAAESSARKATASSSPSSSSQKPAFRRKSGNFSTMSNLMNSLVVKLGLDQRLKEHALMDLWPTIVGDAFATKSRCLFIDNERKLVVSVQDASAGQEISLLRREIMRKMQAAASGLGVKIEGIRFDMKHFYQGASAQSELSLPYERALPKPSPQDLQSVMLSEEEQEQINSMRRGPSDPSSVQGFELSTKMRLSDRIATIFEHELRLKIWSSANGYPICAECSEPSILLHGADKLCAHCFYKSISPRSI
jgi:hypothetical protein